MRAMPILVAAVAAAGCRGGEARDRGEAAGPSAPAAREPGPRAAAACDGAIAAARDADTRELLARCRPCGVAWDPLIALSARDPDEPAQGLPAPAEVLAVLDACGATCRGTARTELTALLDRAREGGSASAPFRKLAEACGALRLDAHTRRFARGTLYALDQLAAAAWAPDAPDALRGLRDRVLPLPALSEASTAIALPRTSAVASWRPRIHLTVSPDRVHAGVLPWLALGEAGPALVPGPGLDYPGDDVTADPREGLARAARERGPYPTAAVVIAPRGMRAARVVEVLAALEPIPFDVPIHLAVTPADRARATWADELRAHVTPITTRPAVGAVPVVIPAHATVADLAAALDAALAPTGAARAATITVDPASSP